MQVGWVNPRSFSMLSKACDESQKKPSFASIRSHRDVHLGTNSRPNCYANHANF